PRNGAAAAGAEATPTWRKSLSSCSGAKGADAAVPWAATRRPWVDTIAASMATRARERVPARKGWAMRGRWIMAPPEKIWMAHFTTTLKSIERGDFGTRARNGEANEHSDAIHAKFESGRGADGISFRIMHEMI